jgi:hypothetical protein
MLQRLYGVSVPGIVCEIDDGVRKTLSARDVSGHILPNQSIKKVFVADIERESVVSEGQRVGAFT